MTPAPSSFWWESLGGISEGAGSVTSPADGCRPATLVLSHTAASSRSPKDTLPWAGGRGVCPEAEAVAFPLRSSWSSAESPGPRGVDWAISPAGGGRTCLWVGSGPMRRGSWAEGCQQGWQYVGSAVGPSPEPGPSISPGGIGTCAPSSPSMS
ncbi:hypothetical protein mRhiFer1_008606 [Rhinolophus ferrumequinum]|uniref:Uncharacterized protein n=1 Tax=Rhinolophus ferrumequinum TaxID=59479 RepID=A0A7J7U0Y1_RHIFE|nr:hypothetical protein mRhiFer1_008606 [Rhinolophus ferrumequinum]